MSEQKEAIRIPFKVTGARSEPKTVWTDDSDHEDGGYWETVPHSSIKLEADIEGVKAKLRIEVDDDEDGEALEVFKENSKFVVSLSPQD